MNFKTSLATIKNVFGKEVLILFVVLALAGMWWTAENIIKGIKPGARAQLELRDGMLIKSADRPEIYRIVNVKRKHIPSPQLFTSYGYRWNDVQIASSADLTRFPEIKLLKQSGDPTLYYIDNLQKRIVKTTVLSSYGLMASDGFTADRRELDAYPDAKLLKVANHEEVYQLTANGMKRHIPTPRIFESYGFKWWNIVTITIEDLDSYPTHNLIALEGKPEIYQLFPSGIGTQKQWIQDYETFSFLDLKTENVSRVNRSEFNSYPTATPLKKSDIEVEPPPSIVSTPPKPAAVQNALNRGTVINQSGDSMLRDLPNYQILYITSADSFLVSILNSNFQTTRTTAENDLLSLLGGDTQTLCSLSVAITTPRFVNPTLAGQSFRPSMCP